MARRISRRGLIALSGAGVLLAGTGAVAHILTRPIATLPTPQPSRGPVTAQISSRIRVHMFQTGWVAVKAEHKSYSGSEGMRFPAIMASQEWTEWMPVTAYAIEHPEGLFVVDTGETADMLDPDYAACDPGTGLFYRRNLQFDLTPEDEIGPQMRRAGLDPEQVTNVIMTHLHSDHMGGMGHFPGKEILVNELASSGHTGALMCRVPSDVTLRDVAMSDTQAGVFPRSHALTTDGAVSIVPTPGHATGHQSVLIQDEGKSVCIVGDAAFSLDQITSGEIGGIVENPADTRASAGLLRDQLMEFDTVMLPSHDPENAARLAGIAA